MQVILISSDGLKVGDSIRDHVLHTLGGGSVAVEAIALADTVLVVEPPDRIESDAGMTISNAYVFKSRNIDKTARVTFIRGRDADD